MSVSKEQPEEQEMAMTAKVPPVFRGVRGHCEVRFTYLLGDGRSERVTGHFERFLGTEADGITGIEVRIDSATAARLRHLPAVAEAEGAGKPAYVQFAAARITPSAETGLIVPVSKKELATGTGAARYIGPSEKQIAYALSLCNRDGEPGGGNFYRPSEAEFRAMSHREISEWIDMAKDEMGI